MIILGVDPGLADLGYGVISAEKHCLKAIEYGVIKTKKGLELAERIYKIHTELEKIIKEYKPRLLAVESLFFCQNVSSALLVGQAKGAVLLTGAQAGIKVMEFTPLQIKETITGYGKAEKLQVQKMVKILLNLSNLPKPDHAADALAAAITGSRYEK